ncbi:MAG TPA: glycosyltransferase family 39 protein [Terriglobales bacterium]
MNETPQAVEQGGPPHLRHRWRIPVAVTVLLLVLAIELVVPARRQSAAYDEGCHTLAGYSYWSRADFGMNPEHPPAMKLWVTLPLLGMPLKYPPPAAIPFFKVECFTGGRDFVYSNGPTADAILFRSRIAAAFLTLLAALLTFAVACEMFGSAAGLLALLLFVFEPTLIAHGSLITTDMGITLFLLAAVYAFYRYAKKPSPVRLLLLGLATGLALATKFSAVLLWPMLALLALGEVVRNSTDSKLAVGGRAKHALRLGRALLVVAVISFAVLWTFYGYRFVARPSGKALTPPLNAYVKGLHQPTTEKLLMGIASHHLLPEAYIYGLADVFITPNYMTSYIFGNLYRHGRWFYFPGALLIKLTLGFLALLLLIPVAIAFHAEQRWREFLFLLVPPAIYLAAAMRSNFNIGVRHILPIYPFLIILVGFAAWSLARSGKTWHYSVAVLVVLHVASSVRTFPNYLPYSNELWGGPSRTYKVLTDSNVDWGQQLKQTKVYLDEHAIKDCWFDYFAQAVADPAYYGIPCKPLQGATGKPTSTPEHISGTVLISATDLSPALWGPGELNPYLQFAKRTPDDTIANGIFVYTGEFDIPLVASAFHAVSAYMLLNTGTPTDAQLAQALNDAQMSVSLSPNICSYCQEILGDVLMKLNRKEEAKAAYQRGLTLAQSVYPDFQEDEIDSLKAKLQK